MDDEGAALSSDGGAARGGVATPATSDDLDDLVELGPAGSRARITTPPPPSWSVSAPSVLEVSIDTELAPPVEREPMVAAAPSTPVIAREAEPIIADELEIAVEPGPDPAPVADSSAAIEALAAVRALAAMEPSAPVLAPSLVEPAPHADAPDEPEEEELSLDDELDLEDDLEDDLDDEPAPAPPAHAAARAELPPPPRAVVPPPVVIPRRQTAPPAFRPPAPPVPPAPPPRPRPVVVVPPLPNRGSTPPATPLPPLEAEVAASPASDASLDRTLEGDVDVSFDEGGALAGAAPPAVAPTIAAEGPIEPSADVPIESRLESPNALARALAALDDQRWQREADALTELGERATAREQQAELAYELGELCERHLADEARAVKAYGKALASDPSLRANLWAIRRVFYRRGLWPNLVKLVDAELRYAASDHERADLLIEKALVQSDKLAAPDDARVALEEALRLDPTAVPALLALERMAAAAGDEVAQCALWAQLATVSELPARRLTYLLDQIAFFTTDRRDLARAAELVTQAAALEIDPDRVAAARLRVAEASGEPEALLAALDAQAELALARSGPAPTGDLAETAPERTIELRRRVVAVRRRQAQIARAAGQGERAWGLLQSAVTLAPAESLLLADLADLAEDLGRHDQLAEVLHRWQAIDGDPRRTLVLSIRRADALLRSGQREAGLELLTSLELTAPGLAPLAALRERDGMLQAASSPAAAIAGDFAPLAAALTRAGDEARIGVDLGAGGPVIADPVTAAAAYVAGATVWAHAVGGERGDREARAALERALEIAPRDPIVLEALVEVHEQAGRIDDAAAVLEAAAGHDRRALARLGRVYRSHGRSDERLVAALDVDRRRSAADPSDLVLAWRIDATLAELGDDAGRLAHLEALAERDRDPARRGYALITAARLADSQGQAERAIELYRQTLAIWPDDDFARGALLSALRRLGRWPELAHAQRQHAERAGSVDEARRALHEAAWTLEDRLGSAGGARAVYGQILDRVPDDAHARAGVARTGLASGEFGPALAALDAIATDSAGSSAALAGPAAVALARAHERVGDTGTALDAYQRAEQVAAPSSVAGPTAALAAWQLALQRSDGGQRIEATRALIRRTSDPRLIAALHEELGWLFALVNEDFDAAATAFVDSLAAAPGRPGPLLGAALVAARRQDHGALSQAYQRLAASVAMPEAAAALHLRCAAMATADGDAEAAAASIAAARSAAPDDVGALLVAAENTAVAAPVGAGEDRGLAVERLVARAEILGLRAALAHDPAARDGWELDRAEALELAGRLKEAGAVVVGVLRSSPGDRRAHETLLRLARRGGDVTTQAATAASLAGQSADLATKLALWSEAAAIYDPEGQGRPASSPGADLAAAVAVYRRMLTDEPDHAVFERLCAILRAHDDPRGLVAALTARLTWLDGAGGDPAVVPITFERATVRRAVGDVHGAANDLDRVLELAPTHKAALRVQAEIHTAIGDAVAAADLWRRYLPVETEPGPRAEAELILSKLLAEDLGDVAGAIEQLEHVIAASPGDLGHRERLVGLASHCKDWRRVARELREIARLRTNPGERARDELRLGQLLRDRVGDSGEAIAAFERGRQLDPINLDLIRELSELLGRERPSAKVVMLDKALADLRAAIAGSPAVATLYDRLASTFGWRGDRDGQWLATAVVEALATPTAEQRELLAVGRKVAAPMPSRQLLDAEARAALQAPSSGGVLAELWRAASAAVNDSVAVDPARLGFGRGDRIALKALGKKYEPAAACLASFGVEDVDIFVSETRPGQARALAASTPILCLGGDVASGATPMTRFLLGRAVWHLADRSAALPELKDAEVVWYLIAALKAAELPVPAALTALAVGDDAAVAERTRLMGKHLARRERKLVVALAGRLTEIAEVAAWRRAVVASGARAGLALAGDLHVALEAIDVGRGGRTLAVDALGLDLAVWTVSAGFLALRRRRGLTIDGAPASGGPR